MARVTTAVRVAATIAGAALLAAAVPAPATAGPIFPCTYPVTPWDGGFSADLRITNNGPTIESWTARFSFDTPTQLLGAWQALMTQQGQTMTGVNMSFNGQIPTGQM